MKKRQTKRKALVAAICAAAILCSCSSNEADSKSDNSEIKALEKKISQLSDKISDLNEKITTFTEEFDEEISYDEDVHPIYDDTAVIEAYKSGDDSKLTDEKDKYILKELKNAIEEIITDDMSEYDKEKAVYDYIYKNTQFNEDSLNAITDDEETSYSHTPYGFFHNHDVICVGDATTFKLFMDALGIECKIIHSTENGEHAWDVVKIDGDWYHVDVLFDGGFGEPCYANFNVPDSVKELADYPWDPEKDDIPECTSTKYCYICQNAEKLDDVYQIPKKLRDLIDEKKTACYYYLEIPSDISAENVMMQIRALNEIAMNTGCLSGLNAVITDDNKKICFGVALIKDMFDDGNSAITDFEGDGLDIDYEKLDELFREELGEYYEGYNYYNEVGVG